MNKPIVMSDEVRDKLADDVKTMTAFCNNLNRYYEDKNYSKLVSGLMVLGTDLVRVAEELKSYIRSEVDKNE